MQRVDAAADRHARRRAAAALPGACTLRPATPAAPTPGPAPASVALQQVSLPDSVASRLVAACFGRATRCGGQTGPDSMAGAAAARPMQHAQGIAVMHAERHGTWSGTSDQVTGRHPQGAFPPPTRSAARRRARAAFGAAVAAVGHRVVVGQVLLAIVITGVVGRWGGGAVGWCGGEVVGWWWLTSPSTAVPRCSRQLPPRGDGRRGAEPNPCQRPITPAMPCPRYPQHPLPRRSRQLRPRGDGRRSKEPDADELPVRVADAQGLDIQVGAAAVVDEARDAALVLRTDHVPAARGRLLQGAK